MNPILTLLFLALATSAQAYLTFPRDQWSDNPSVTQLVGSNDGWYGFHGQVEWGRGFGDFRSASFTLPEGYASVSYSGQVPNNGSLVLYDYTGGMVAEPIWTIGDEYVPLGPGEYAMRWTVPAGSRDGSPRTSGEVFFGIQIASVPEHSASALILGLIVLSLGQRRRCRV